MPTPRDPSIAADLRRAYNAFRTGARLRPADVVRLLAARGHRPSNNALRELGRNSDRGLGITAEQLADLISAWTDEVLPPRS